MNPCIFQFRGKTCDQRNQHPPQATAPSGIHGIGRRFPTCGPTSRWLFSLESAAICTAQPFVTIQSIAIRSRVAADARRVLRPQNPRQSRYAHPAGSRRVSGNVRPAIFQVHADALHAQRRSLRGQSPPGAESAMPGLSSRRQARHDGAKQPLPYGSTGRRRSQPSLMPLTILHQMRRPACFKVDV